MAVCLLLIALVHPFHRSLIEMHWNEQEQFFEVALRVDPHDLDLAISRHQGRRIVLEQLRQPEAKGLIGQYVAKHFKLYRSPESPGKLTLVGFEPDERGKHLWIYFELRRPTGDAALLLDNRIFSLEEPTHVGTVIFPNLPKRPSLTFHQRKLVQKLPEPLQR